MRKMKKMECGPLNNRTIIRRRLEEGNASCSFCRFWEPDYDDENCEKDGSFGHCKRYPPQIIRIDNNYDNSYRLEPEYPLMMMNDWCGEWQLNQEEYVMRTNEKISKELKKEERYNNQPLENFED